MRNREIPFDELTDFAPDELLGEPYPLSWQMTRQERFCLIHLLGVMAPEMAIEVGTYKGGSLQVLSKYSGQVVSIDVDPQVAAALGGQFPNVEFQTGDSAELLPALITKLNNSAHRVGFVFIDADHTEAAVWRDVSAALAIEPRRPLCVVVHDSFHPASRMALRQVDWKSNPFVHYVDLDFASGVLVPGRASAESAMFGGLALALLKPEPRDFELDIFESQRRLFDIALRCSDISPDNPS